VDPFAVVVIVVVAVAVGAAVLSAKANAGKPLSEFGNGTELRFGATATGLDEQDLQELLAATNARRRARGLTERSLADAIEEFEAD
jgi:hypothetical protein